MIAIRFNPPKSDPCIYIYTHTNGVNNPATKKGPTFASWEKDAGMLTICADDLLLVGQNKMLLKKLEEKPVRCSDTKCMGGVSMVVRTRGSRDRKKGTFTVSKTYYTKLAFETYGMGVCQLVRTI